MKSSFLRSLLVLGAAAAVTVVAPSEAEASTIAENGSITIDYEKQVLIIDGDEVSQNQIQASSKDEAKNVVYPAGDNIDLQISFGVATYKKAAGNNPEKLTPPKTWDVCDVEYAENVNETVAGQYYNISRDPEEVRIDLSSLKNTVDNYIMIKGSKNTDPITIKIPAILSKVQGTFNPVTATVQVDDITDKKSVKEVTGIEYRTAYSNWSEYDPVVDGSNVKTDLSLYQPKGATLYFRIASQSDPLAYDAMGDGGNIADATRGSEIKFPVKVAKAFPGKEIKVAIPKLANAPKIKADFVKQQFTLAKGAEYRINTVAGFGEWTAAPMDSTGKKVLPLDASGINGTAGTIELRTAKVETKDADTGAYVPKKCKAASKASQLEFNAKGAAPVVTTGKTVADGATVTAEEIAKFDVTQNKLVVDDKEVTVAYDEAKKTLTITNGTSNIYEAILVAENDEGTYTAPTADAKVTKVAAATATAAKATKITRANPGARVYIRKAGDAKNSVWSTDFVALGTIGGETNEPVVTPPDDTDTTTE